MGGITVKDVNALPAGGKLLVAPGTYLRRNLNDTLTVWLRMKQAGKSVDIKAGAADLPITKTTLADLLADAVAMRRKEAKRKPAPTPLTTTLLNKDSTVGEVWDDLFQRITASGKWTPRTTKNNSHRVQRYLVGSTLWKLPIGEVQPLHITNLLQPMAKTPDQQKKVRSLLSLVFLHSMGAGLIQSNPATTAGAVLRVTSKAKVTKHFPTITEVARLQEIYKRIDTLDSKAGTRAALKMQALTCQRTSEVLQARWSEIDLATGWWTIPRTRMKVKDSQRGNHTVPLSAQSIELLLALEPGKPNEYLFKGRQPDTHMSENTLPQAMRRDMALADEFVPHSWRSAFRTLAGNAEDQEGRPLFAETWLEAVLDHQKASEVEAAYVRKQQMSKGAARAMQWWADLLTAKEVAK